MSTLKPLVLLALFAQLVVVTEPTRADDSQPLLPRQPVLDMAPSASAPAALPTPSPSTTAPSMPSGAEGPDGDGAPAARKLSGAVSRTDTIPAAPDPAAGNAPAAMPTFDPSAFFSGRLSPPGAKANININVGQLKAILNAMRSSNMTGAYSVFLKGNPTDQGTLNFGSRNPAMSSDEYRKLAHGVIGLDATVQLDTDCPVVTGVYPTCPAAEAGIRPGDLLVKANDHIFKLGEGQAVFWKIIGGKAGTAVDVTVLRDGQVLTFHMIRMNIEDIKDDRIRITYENLLGALGPPGQ